MTGTEQTIKDAGHVAVQRVDAKTVDVLTTSTDSTGATKPAQEPFNLVATC